MHWCMDETLAVLAMIPFLGVFFTKVHTWWHKRFQHKCHEEGCKAVHLEHTSVPILLEKENEWDSICEEDLEERFGEDLLSNLMVEIMLSPLDYPVEGEAHCFVNGDNSTVTVHLKERVFLCDVASSKRWVELLQ